MRASFAAFILILSYDFWRAKNEEAGEIPVAFVVTRSGSKRSSTDVIEFVAKQVSTLIASVPFSLENHKSFKKLLEIKG